MWSPYILLAVIVPFVWCTKLEQHSFEPPFNDVDNSGSRQVGRYWRSSGAAVVNNNFVRLTPDRQSKKGALWSRKALGVPSFSCILKFRISGQGKTFFGDGIALWIVQQGYYAEGPLHGFQEKYVGVGIVFDTFKNTESLQTHRDVTVYVNDGEKTWDMMAEIPLGCNGNFRYHNDRADFSVTDASRAKVFMDGKSLVLAMDSKNSGQWDECVTIPDLGLPDDWLSRAHIGITASTGALADNHDVLSLVSFSDLEVMLEEEEQAQNKKSFDSNTDAPVRDRLAKVEAALDAIMSRLDVMDHHVEHELEGINDHISNMIGKINSREDKSETRIGDIEQLIKERLDDSMSERMDKLERQVVGQVNNRVKGVEKSVNRQIGESMESMNAVSSGWKIPFAILILMFVGGAIGLFFYYKLLLKKHLL